MTVTNQRNHSTTPPAEPLRLSHFPAICALLVHGHTLTNATKSGNFFEAEFERNAETERVLAAARDPRFDVLVPLDRYMNAYDLLRDATRGRRPLPVGKRLYALTKATIIKCEE